MFYNFLRIISLILILVSLPSLSYPFSAENIYDNIKDSIFTIYSINEENREKSALGSGVAIEKNLLATNCHVALAGRFLVVEVNGKDRLGRLVYYNQERDICLIEIVEALLKPVNIRPSKSVKIGEEVFAIGNPENIEKTISRGIISNKIQYNGIEVLITDASISHGSSGGGLFDIDGNLIGITKGFHKSGENITFALPTELILKVIGSQNSVNSQSKPKKEIASSSVTKTEFHDNKLISLGYYGEDKIELLKINKTCLIGITGRYNNKPASIVIWLPHKPEGLFIFSRIVNA